ncbi:hypothetical protein FIBSPDRAFT_165665 [Athelia psychrophila]|uniref:Uncharacterized protein n=1 Tax=Athelia psychrophila TaxID=1759441 RepID=A0A166B464_9AGAM|nr:hypothetical protein FIBSPDRAFT_165665 [Fibularhizoctonia sp. CBS 109695]
MYLPKLSTSPRLFHTGLAPRAVQLQQHPHWHPRQAQLRRHGGPQRDYLRPFQYLVGGADCYIPQRWD